MGDVGALNDLLVKLIGKRKDRMKCFADIWNHQVFHAAEFDRERFSTFREYLQSGEVRHDEDIMRVVDANVAGMFEDAVPDQFKRHKERIQGAIPSTGLPSLGGRSLILDGVVRFPSV